jgi:hypothetical protein
MRANLSLGPLPVRYARARTDRGNPYRTSGARRVRNRDDRCKELDGSDGRQIQVKGRRGAGAHRERTGEMDEQPRSKRRGFRRNVWVNTTVLLLLLAGVLLGITQAFILLAVYTLVIAPA